MQSGLARFPFVQTRIRAGGHTTFRPLLQLSEAFCNRYTTPLKGFKFFIINKLY